MELEITPGRGQVKAFKMTSDGKTVEHLVSDPANATGPMPHKDWVEQTGGTAPLDAPKPPETPPTRE